MKTKLLEWKWSIATCLVAYVALVALNWADLVHPFWVVIALVLVEVLRGAKDILTRLVLVSCVVIGAIPVTGWLHLPNLVDPVVLILVGWGLLIARDVRENGVRITADSLAPIPALAGGVFTYQWWCGLSDGSSAVVLEKLLPIWDLSTHFLFFVSNLLSGTYIAQMPSPTPNLVWEGREYPSGIHFVWGRFAAGLRNEISYDTSRAISVFANSVVVTVAIAVTIVGVCVGRLGTTWLRRLVLTTIGTGLGAGLLALGPMSQTIWAGFANMPAIIVGLSVLISVCIRPIHNFQIQLLVLVCGTWILIYNWYPIILLIAPAILFQGFQIAKKHGWRCVLLSSALTTVGGALPIWYSLSLGISHMENQGGVQPFPIGLLIGSVLGLSAVGLFCSKDQLGVPIWLLTSTPFLLLVVHGLRLRIITDAYPYYFHKAGLFIGSYAVVLLVALLVVTVDRRAEAREITRVVILRALCGGLIAAIGLSQTFGYWGPDYPTLAGANAAAGVLYRNDITKGSNDFLPTAQLVVDESRNIRHRPIIERSCLTLMIPDRLGVLPKDDPRFGGTANSWRDVLANIWFHSLTQSYTSAAREQAYMTPALSSSTNDENALANAIATSFDIKSVCIFSSRRVNSELNQLNPAWRTRDLSES